MDTKLTLKLSEEVIERAKQYAADRKLSLSRLIENYLEALTLDNNKPLDISPYVKSIAKGKSVSIGVEEK